MLIKLSPTFLQRRCHSSSSHTTGCTYSHMRVHTHTHTHTQTHYTLPLPPQTKKTKCLTTQHTHQDTHTHRHTHTDRTLHHRTSPKGLVPFPTIPCTVVGTANKQTNR